MPFSCQIKIHQNSYFVHVCTAIPYHTARSILFNTSLEAKPSNLITANISSYTVIVMTQSIINVSQDCMEYICAYYNIIRV